MTRTGSPRTLLVNAPFGLIEFPHLGTSLIKAATVAAGFACDVLYASIDFARQLGVSQYLSIQRAANSALLPERPFAPVLFGNVPPLQTYYDEIVMPFDEPLHRFVHYPEALVSFGLEGVRRAEAGAAAFVDELVGRPELASYDVIAFSSSYGQHVASLAIAKRLKERYPGVVIAFGGANCEGVMGKQLVRSFPFVDYAFAGDGDVAFPLFLAALRDGRPVRLPGVFHRDTLARDDSDLGAPLTRQDLDALPYPDYSDYFAALARIPDGARTCKAIPIEGSRGCWWGEKHHCTFCGLNGMTMKYRAKTPARFAAELRHLVERYRCTRVMAADNIFDHAYFKGLLPTLAEDRVHDLLFFEIKANLSKDEVRALADAGITHLQPGIESLSTPVLKLMDKGTTCVQNVQLLKWAEEYGITLIWNILCGFPGETPADYDRLAAVMRRIPHLQPPGGVWRIEINRFSPYFNQPQKYGMEIHPSVAYRYVYDLPPEAIANLAYFYYYSCENGSSRVSPAPPDYARPVVHARAIWHRAHGKVQFRYTTRGDGRVLLEDSRPIVRERETLLDPVASEIFLLADRAVTRDALHRHFAGNGAGPRCRPEEVDRILEGLEARSILLHEDGRYLALATTAACRKRAPALGECAALGQ